MLASKPNWRLQSSIKYSDSQARMQHMVCPYINAFNALHWLPIEQRIQLKIYLEVQKVLDLSQSTYICLILVPHIYCKSEDSRLLVQGFSTFLLSSTQSSSF